MHLHYINLTVIPDEEVSAPQLVSALYDKLHLALVKEQITNIGVSFPYYRGNPRALGEVLRLHGPELVLSKLMKSDWMKHLCDYIKIEPIALAPSDASHRTVYRRQFQTNVERLRRRRMKRKRETVEEVRKAIPDAALQVPDLPYVWLRSRSTHQRFCLFIAMGEPRTEPNPGIFSTYGLSTEATIPWF